MSNREERRRARIAQAIAELRAKYVVNLPDQVASLSAAIETVRREPPGQAPAALEEGARLAHRLHGTGGSLGLTRISQIGGELEQALQALPSADPDSAAAIWQSIDQALASLREALAELE